VHLGAEVPAGTSADRLRAAVTGISLAIELADLDQPPDDVESILRGNIYHRHVIVGGPTTGGLDPASVHPRVLRDEAEVGRPDDVQALTGELEVVLQQTAETLATAGGRLAAGDIVIVGSFVPPIDVSPGQCMKVAAPGYEPVSVVLE
jgi:2-keto-4-pentenoate hydratase